ncbi:hypothetical protein DYH09_16870 [bacterium CPR1]|nr:hypothetical protein [bacterium CPR1]
MSRLGELTSNGAFRLMVSLPKNRVDMALAAVEAGAEILKVHLNCHHFASDTRFGSWRDEKPVLREILDAVRVPVGIVTGEETQPTAAEWAELSGFGFDFWDLFARYTAPGCFDVPGLGRMVAVDDSWTGEMVQDMVKLGVDVFEASIIPRTQYRTPLNLVDLTRYAALGRAARVPIMVPSQKALRPDEVGWLRRVGASGVTIGAIVTGLEPDGLRAATASFRAAIDALG